MQVREWIQRHAAALAGLYVVLLMVMQWAPLGGAGPPGRGDLAVHFLAYVGLGLLLGLACGGRWRRVVAWGAPLAVTMEAVQAGLPHRTFDLGDLAGNLAGVAAAAWWWAARRR